MSQPPDRPRFAEKFFGRRAGQTLRDNHVRLVETLLPKLRVPDCADSLQDPRALFGNSVSEVWLEVGFGGGEHLAWQAAANPHVGFIGGEPFINGVAKLLSLLEDGSLSNVRIIDNDIRPRLDQLGDQTISRAFLLFPDPWPKLRHHKRRVVNQTNLNRLQSFAWPAILIITSAGACAKLPSTAASHCCRTTRQTGASARRIGRRPGMRQRLCAKAGHVHTCVF